MLNEIIIIAFLLVLNAFFALSEMAIVSSSKPLLRQYAKQGKKSAEIAIDLAENSGRFLSTVQVGITLVGTLAGAFGGAALAERLAPFFEQFPIFANNAETVAMILVVGAITYFSVVLGELVPKQVALNNAEGFAMFVAKPMNFLSVACTPVVIALEWSAKVALAALGVKERSEEVTEMEVKAVIASGAASGAIEEVEHEVMQRVIKLGDRDVKSIMTHRGDVTFIDIDDSLETIRTKISDADHSRYPVIHRDPTKILGMIKTKDLFMKVDGGNNFNVHDYIKEMYFVDETMTTIEALNLFRTQTLHMAAVIDEYGSFEGLFTTSDLMEAIVGVLPSNYDKDDEPLIYKRDDGSWLVDGMTPVEEIQVTIGIDDIDEKSDYQTIAGFVLDGLREIPTVGAIMEYGGFRFEIVDMDNHRIDKILIQKL